MYVLDFQTVDKTQILMTVLDRMGVRYRRTRSGWQAVRCPNGAAHTHDDRSASASISLAKGRLFCHVCGTSGDGFDLARTFLCLTPEQTAALAGSGGVGEGWLF